MCTNCGSPWPSSPEYLRRRNPQNHNGCSCKSANTCDTPSVAPEGTPTYDWEQVYGKLVTTITYSQNEWGRTVQVVEKLPCPAKAKKHSHGCCSLRYKVSR